MKWIEIKRSSFTIALSALCITTACGDDDGGTTPSDTELDAGETDSTDTEGTDTDSTDTETDPPGTDTGGTDDTTDQEDAGPDETDTDPADDAGTSTDIDAGEDAATEVSNSITDIASGNDDFTILAGALEATGLDEALSGEGPFTVFAPTDEAFALLPEGLVDDLDAEQLTQILSYHVLAGQVYAGDLQDGASAATLLDGASLAISLGADGAFINGLTEIVVTDIEADNGVIHVIDSVLVPGAFPGSIVDLLNSRPRAMPLAAAVEAAGLEDALAADGLTLFAPVASAFDGLEVPEDEAALTELLTYHAVDGKLGADVVVESSAVQMLSGGFAVVKTDDSAVSLYDGSGESNVIYTDIELAGEQGSVVHLIDRVLLPPPTLAEVAAAAEFNELLSLLDEEVPGSLETFAEALSGEGTFTVFAPTDAAFQAIPGQLGSDLDDVLGAHVIPSAFDSVAVVAAINAGTASPATLTGADDNTLSFSLAGESLLVNSMVGVTGTDIPASNGIIHVVDSVILPADVGFPGNIVEALSAYPSFSTLVGAVSGLSDNSIESALSGGGSDRTLFAPFNAAFQGLALPDSEDDLASVLAYHLVPAFVDSAAVVSSFMTPADVTTASGEDVSVDGSSLTVNDANIVRTDLRTENGIIHVVDGVLIPPSLTQPGGDAGATDAGM